jgi:hypothetical protein
VTRTDDRPAGARPPAIDVSAAVLVFGGLFGLSQLAIGDFTITGSLPTQVPILGVAIFMNGASVALGILIRGGRGWLPALSLAALYALLYLAAMGRPLNLLLGAAHLAAAGILLAYHRWFADQARQ